MVVACSPWKDRLLSLILIALCPVVFAAPVAPVAVWLPVHTASADLQVRVGAGGNPVRLTDDGSLCFDAPGDGEWWGLVEVGAGAASVDLIFTGDVAGVRLQIVQTVDLVDAGGGLLEPVTFRVVRVAGGMELVPVGPTQRVGTP
jgi:hypothetical protein